jgi:FtsZ-interacting cell division protein ZipA
MRTLSLILIVCVGLAIVGLLYETAAEQRRTQLRARQKRDLERMKTPAPLGSSVRPHSGR